MFFFNDFVFILAPEFQSAGRYVEEYRSHQVSADIK